MSKFKEIIKCIQNETERLKSINEKNGLKLKQNVNNLKKIDRRLDGFFKI